MEETKKEKFIAFEQGKKARLQRMITDAHNNADHPYIEDPEWPGTCLVCDWYTQEQQEKICPDCGETAKKHIQDKIAEINQVIAKTEAMDEDEWQEQIQRAIVLSGLVELVALLDVLEDVLEDEFFDE